MCILNGALHREQGARWEAEGKAAFDLEVMGLKPETAFGVGTNALAKPALNRLIDQGRIQVCLKCFKDSKC
jgi:hypothetical protein